MQRFFVPTAAGVALAFPDGRVLSAVLVSSSYDRTVLLLDPDTRVRGGESVDLLHYGTRFPARVASAEETESGCWSVQVTVERTAEPPSEDGAAGGDERPRRAFPPPPRGPRRLGGG